MNGSSTIFDPLAVNAAWLNVPAHPALRAGEPHVWRAPLDLDEHRLACLHGTLSADERARAARFHFECDRNHFIAARGLLRELLGRYLDRAPASLRFAYGAHGKPFLAESEPAAARMTGDVHGDMHGKPFMAESEPAAARMTGDVHGDMHGETTLLDDGLRFNLSHSHGLGLFAFVRGVELGVDIEQVRLDFASAEIAERFFSPRELAALCALPLAQRAEGFFNCWTRKEAYIKARGDGLSIPLDSFDVTLTPGDRARLLDVRGAPDEVARWSLHALTPAPGYVAALIVEGRTSSISLRLCAFA